MMRHVRAWGDRGPESHYALRTRIADVHPAARYRRALKHHPTRRRDSYAGLHNWASLRLSAHTHPSRFVAGTSGRDTTHAILGDAGPPLPSQQDTVARSTPEPWCRLL